MSGRSLVEGRSTPQRQAQLSASASSSSSSRSQPNEEDYTGREAMQFLRTTWTSLIHGREWPFTLTQFDDLLTPSQVPTLIRVLHELIQAFLKRRQSPTIQLTEDAVRRNPSMALQTSIISLEDALEVELGFIKVPKLAEGNKEEALNLCQTVS